MILTVIFIKWLFKRNDWGLFKSLNFTTVSEFLSVVLFLGGVIVAADYSQLELRIIAHLSDDKKLISILNDDGDVFKMIAAQWKHTAPEAVTAEQRQQAKQVNLHACL